MTAMFAAYLLVLQALLSGLACGANSATAATLDAFGQVICGSGTAAPGGPSGPAHHTPDCCCTTGCHVSITGGAPAPVALAVPLSAELAVLEPAFVEAGHPATRHDPHNARAPPLA